MSEEKTCFVLAPIGSEGTETRERSDTVFEDVIREVVEDFDYECIRADHLDQPGSIKNQVIELIVESELVIADLTDKNPNVFYELAVRHAHRRPVIQLINKDQEIPFDVATQRTIDIDLGDFSTTKQAQNKIRNQIKEIESNEFEVENPVSVAGRIRELKESEEPEKQELAEFTETLNEINSKVRSIEKEVNNSVKTVPPEVLEKVESNIEGEEYRKILNDLQRINMKCSEICHEMKEEDTITAEIMNEMNNLNQLIAKLRYEVETAKDPDQERLEDVLE